MSRTTAVTRRPKAQVPDEVLDADSQQVDRVPADRPSVGVDFTISLGFPDLGPNFFDEWIAQLLAPERPAAIASKRSRKRKP